MNRNQSAAFLQAQTALMLAEMEMMKVENADRISRDLPCAYGLEQWEDFRERWEGTLGHNAVTILFRDCED